LRARSPYFYPAGTEWSSYTPGHWVPFLVASYDSQSYGGGILTRLHTGCSKYQVRVRVRVTLRLTISQSVCLGIEPNLGQLPRVCFLLEISFRQLQVCNFVAPSLTRELVCKLLYNCFWALPEQSLLGRSPAELTALFCCLN
jgi:hypothetical protein